MMRILAGVALLLAGLTGAAFALVAPGRPTVVAAALAIAALLFGFLALRVAAVPPHPWRPFRLALGVGLLLAAYLFYGLAWPPHGTEWWPALILATGVVASVAAIALVDRAPRVVLAVVGVLAVYGALMAVNILRFLSVAFANTWRPAVVISFLLAISVGAAWVAALGHLLWTRRRLAATDAARAT
jgi:hypothetical protein